MSHTVAVVFDPKVKLQNIPIQELADDEILVRVLAVSLNTSDTQYARGPFGERRVVGSDFAGRVSKIGVKVQQWKEGDRVAGLLQGAATTGDGHGAFSDHTILKADLAIRIPEDISYEQASTVPLSALATAQMLFLTLGLNAPFPHPVDVVKLQDGAPSVLIHSPSNSIGRFAVKLALNSRTSDETPYRIYVTASKAYHQTLLDLGVKEGNIFDDSVTHWPQQVFIKSGAIDAALDCVAEGESTEKMSRTFKPTGTIATVQDSESKERVRYGVTARYIPVWAGVSPHPDDHDDKLSATEAAKWRDFTVKFFEYLSDKPEYFQLVPPKSMPNGLQGIEELLNDPAKHPEISSEKLVYTLKEAPPQKRDERSWREWFASFWS